MYVCICRGVTDEQIRHEVRNGANTLPEVCRRLGVASNCGRCRDCAIGIVEDALCDCPAPGTPCPVAA